jgi:hypothetical protein
MGTLFHNAQLRGATMLVVERVVEHRASRDRATRMRAVRAQHEVVGEQRRRPAHP